MFAILGLKNCMVIFNYGILAKSYVYKIRLFKKCYVLIELENTLVYGILGSTCPLCSAVTGSVISEEWTTERRHWIRVRFSKPCTFLGVSTSKMIWLRVKYKSKHIKIK